MLKRPLLSGVFLLFSMGCLGMCPNAKPLFEDVHIHFPEPVEPCGTELEESNPGPDAADVFYGTTIDFRFDEPTGDEEIHVFQDGLEVPGTTALVGAHLMFTPDALLSPDTAYEVELTWCDETTTHGFTTSAVGEEVDPSLLDHRTFLVDLAGSREILPPMDGIFAALSAAALMSVTVPSADTLVITSGVGDELGGQDWCFETTPHDSPVSFADNPYFVSTAPQIAFTSEAGLIHIYDTALSGAFVWGAEDLVGGTLSGLLDMREFEEFFAGDGCELMATLGSNCEPCPHGSETCVELFVDGVSARWGPDLALVPVTTDEVLANPDCAVP